ncbi:MAG TPA: 2TM domain-containing protein [Rubrobacter sp.]|nr:2TM domain-containing protein [Rubrobacter sp.]
MATTLKMSEYQDAERVLAHEEGRRGFIIHTLITLVVWAIVIPINVFLADEFPWSAFIVVGMSIGLAVHYMFGARRVDRLLSTHQRAVESLATERHAA